MSQLHQRKRTESSLSDIWETPKNVFDWLCAKYKFYPVLDICANYENKKCISYFGSDNTMKEYKDGLKNRWAKKNWCNPPHSETEKWVKKACQEFIEYHNETMMIIPANSTTTSYAECCIEPHAESYPIYERPRFKQDGIQKDSARNGYYVILWRRK